ncbi:STAS domain-containing protein [Actinoplanes sp. DH11]|uniref:STAS domain-containing protein n=1 Tax=Actinoplanes sp. DH11 TaxID=2857011 RepID=UPI001E396E7A|nr:STAS domain-containing protein [Actinoplanes sp. DH11]
MLSEEGHLILSRRAMPDRIRVLVAGDIDYHTAPALQQELMMAAADHPGLRLEADLDAVTFFSCAGITVLLIAKHQLTDRFVVIAAGPSVARLLRHCGIRELYDTI